MQEKQQSKVKVYVAVPTTGTIVDSQTYFWRRAEKLYGDKIEFIWPEVCVRRIFHDAARNAHVEDFLASSADILFFLDSDVVPPPDLFDMVLEHEKWKVAGAPYPIFMTPSGCSQPQIMFTAYKGRTAKGLGAADVPATGTEFIDGLATGCLFIKREVLEQIAKPYFAFKYDEETRAMTEGEDLSFCKKVTDLGYKFYVDYSKTARHYKNVCLLEMNNYTMDYAKRSVETYASLMKPFIEELQRRVRAIKKPSAIIKPSLDIARKILNP